jgi:hypothetical protein
VGTLTPSLTKALREGSSADPKGIVSGCCTRSGWLGIGMVVIPAAASVVDCWWNACRKA